MSDKGHAGGLYSFISAVVAPFAMACAVTQVADDREPRHVDLAVVADDPMAYDGRSIEVDGAAVFQFERQFICADAEAIVGERRDRPQCVWIGIPDVGEGMDAEEIAALHGKLVVLAGRFVAKEKGHFGAYAGTIIPQRARIIGTHDQGDIPPPPPEPPKPIRRD
jgi:hypothetical protein